MLAGGVVNENIEATRVLRGTVDKPLTERRIPNVAWQGQLRATSRFDQFDNVPRVRLLLRAIAKGNIGAIAGKSEGRSTAHPRIAACHQGFAADKSPRPLVSLLAMVGRSLHVADQARPVLMLLVKRRLGILCDRVLFQDRFIGIFAVCADGLSIGNFFMVGLSDRRREGLFPGRFAGASGEFRSRAERSWGLILGRLVNVTRNMTGGFR